MDSAVVIAKGYRFAGVYCGVKRDTSRRDLTLVVSDRAATAAGVYTQNLVVGAPVTLGRERTPSDAVRAVVVNSGVANACTGQRGLDDAREMTRLAGETCGATAEQALVMSTGVIGEFLPMEKISAGIADAASKLDDSEEAVVAAAQGMMTTDTMHKIACREIEVDGQTVRLTGMAKGAAMIGPNMATMLGLVLTDATLEKDAAQQLLRDIVEDTFNCISVEGHTSTSDTVLLLANGAANGAPLAGEALGEFVAALRDVCEELARAIPNDGEGAAHLITIDVDGCVDRAAAKQIAKTVADSALVKTAIAGADPNWGRIVSAAGYAGVPFNPAKVDLKVNGVSLYEQGTPVPFDAEAVSASIRDNRDTLVELSFGEGEASIRFYTTDLTAEYVRLNADYHT